MEGVCVFGMISNSKSVSQKLLTAPLMFFYLFYPINNNDLYVLK